MTYVFGPASETRLKGLHPDLVRVLRRALQLSEIDFTIIEAVRTDEQCFINFGKGRTAQQCRAGGCPPSYARPNDNKVTWLTKALSSNHRKKADGFGYAVDLYPYPVNQVLGKKPKEYEPLFDKIAKAVLAAAKELKINVRWGANWDMDNMPRERGETDNPHFELKK